MVGGEVSRDSECSARQQECERPYAAKCEQVAERRAGGCAREADECLAACQE